MDYFIPFPVFPVNLKPSFLEIEVTVLDSRGLLTSPAVVFKVEAEVHNNKCVIQDDDI